jgi:hypothetical protein
MSQHLVSYSVFTTAEELSGYVGSCLVTKVQSEICLWTVANKPWRNVWKLNRIESNCNELMKFRQCLLIFCSEYFVFLSTIFSLNWSHFPVTHHFLLSLALSSVLKWFYSEETERSGGYPNSGLPVLCLMSYRSPVTGSHCLFISIFIQRISPYRL